MNAVRFTFLGQGLIRSNISACAFCKDLTPLTWSRAIVTTITTANKAPKSQTPEDFWDKNKRLKRPMSPHLTIYKPQVTSLLSVTHRGTGVFLATVVTSFSIGMLALPGSFPHYLSMIEAMHFGSFLIFLAKFGLAFPFLFHLCNGVRHLAWDLGYGFNLRDLYKSGYFVLGSSLVLATIAAAL